MKDKDEVRVAAQKLLTLQRLKQGLEQDGGEGFTIKIARGALPTAAAIDKLCEEYHRTWEKREPYTTRAEAETELIVHSSEDSGWNLMMIEAIKMYGQSED